MSAIANAATTHRYTSIAEAPGSKPARRLRPEVVARITARRVEQQIEDLYRKPVHDLSPDEIALMKLAFLRG